MTHSTHLESVFEDVQISDICEADEATVLGGFFSIVNFDFSANYSASSGITTPRGVTRGQINVQATGRGPATIQHFTQGYVRY